MRPWVKLGSSRESSLEMYEYIALSVLLLSEGVVSQSQDLLCTTGNSNGFNGGKIHMLRRDNGVIWILFTVMYRGQCRDLYEDGICALGERLFLIDGNVQCDCDEVKYEIWISLYLTIYNWFSKGWLRYEGRCHQEFTPAFCGENEVLNLGTRRRLRGRQTFTCVPNPCDANQLAHRWKSPQQTLENNI